MNSAPKAFQQQIIPVRVYYEDTDAAGIVYYANYLRYLERGRTEFLRALGHEQREIAAALGVAFAVRSVAVEYLLPARLDDALEVVTRVAQLGRAQLTFHQQVRRDGELLLEAQVRIVCLDLNKNKAAPLPRYLHEQFKACL